MKEACKQQLDWSVERYAQLPRPPEFLKLEDVPPFWKGFMAGGTGCVFWFYSLFSTLLTVIGVALHGPSSSNVFEIFLNGGFFLNWVPLLGMVIYSASKHLRVKNANGNKPLENARRKKAHEAAVAAALKAAIPLKEAQDHRLRCQIRDLEGLAKTVDEKAAEIRRILATLQ
ncbi:MAG: hypothetical protein EXQ57_07510 [Bryobacterales bacterium]|nr:hypothetical protein [Bryobacterales bacterium]